MSPARPPEGAHSRSAGPAERPEGAPASTTRRLTCREAARLLFGTLDGAVPEIDRDALEAHIRICEACVRVQSQVDFMRQAMGAWRRYRDGATDNGMDRPQS
jgi:hypothetical protein